MPQLQCQSHRPTPPQVQNKEGQKGRLNICTKKKGGAGRHNRQMEARQATTPKPESQTHRSPTACVVQKKAGWEEWH